MEMRILEIWLKVALNLATEKVGADGRTDKKGLTPDQGSVNSQLQFPVTMTVTPR